MNGFAGAEVQAWLVWVVRTLAAAGVAALILAGCRHALGLSASGGRLVAIGVSLRLLGSAVLFFVSYLDLPVLRPLHTSDGFWRVAPDARLYYDLALGLPRADGMTALSEAAPSPGFVRALSAWMWAVGPGPAAAALLNTCCYLAGCLLVLRLLRGEERAMRLLIAAFTFSPALLVFGSQPLKDVLFLGLVVALCGAAWLVLADAARRSPAGGPAWRDAALLAAGFFVLAGIRGYYAIFLLAALAAALPLAVLAVRPLAFGRLGRAAAVLFLSAVAVVGGMGANGRAGLARISGVALPALASRPPAPAVNRPSPGPLPTTVESKLPPVVARALLTLDRARAGFVLSGGSTNFAREKTPEGLGGRLEATLEGLAVMTVPVFVLRPLGVVGMAKGGGFMAIAELDTLFNTAVLVAGGFLLWRRARVCRRHAWYLAFVALIVMVSGIGMAYVVTNFGTLFRLRLMVMVPLWMALLALGDPQVANPAPERAVANG